MIASTQTNHPIVGETASARLPNPIEYATGKLKSAGLRVTQPRLSIVGALAACTQPISIEDLHSRVGSEACDLVTVYRCMAAFEEIGLVRRAYFNDGAAVYELNLGLPAAYHVVCRETKRVEEIDSATAAELRAMITQIEERLQARGYRDVRHIVEFFGVAPREPVAARRF